MMNSFRFASVMREAAPAINSVDRSLVRVVLCFEDV